MIGTYKYGKVLEIDNFKIIFLWLSSSFISLNSSLDFLFFYKLDEELF